jgi:hypothetical protein
MLQGISVVVVSVKAKQVGSQAGVSPDRFR